MHDDGSVVRVLASTRQRLAARAFDFLATFLVAMVAVSPIYVFLHVADSSTSTSAILGLVVPVLIFGMAGPVLLRIGTIAQWGCTVGQRVAGIRVVREEDGIRPPGWRRSGRRYALPRSAQTFGLISDSWEQRNDKRLGQCMHDRRAKTVVVQAQAPPAAAETGGLAALASPDSGSPAAHDHVRRWEKRERVRRIALGSAIGLLGAVVLVSPFVAGRLAAAEPSRGEPAFEVSTFYEDAARFEVRSGTRSATFERTAFKVLDDEKGCLAGATSEQVRNVLRENRCTGRIEVAFQTTEGVLVSSHILRFPELGYANEAERSLRHTDLRFVPGGPIDPPGGAHSGRLGSPDRYVVSTTAVSPRQPDAASKARNAFVLMHAPTVSTILWL
ncbi:RDD family protein [Actinomadura madurae]|uniref:RDD family protein n=1 Tax=Actinomadura madurae TaxID=1993 RepID=UPI0020D1F7F3|nr:RDD family protein [Actinomadura madurae]MCP9947097.1 RDD family protein [Actinomadura madurae]MCQ0012175.1 RDD family protein [Actinomadura madurae]MCQ0012532.1 RDD family protein [Actinomadura madurae]